MLWAILASESCKSNSTLKLQFLVVGKELIFFFFFEIEFRSTTIRTQVAWTHLHRNKVLVLAFEANTLIRRQNQWHYDNSSMTNSKIATTEFTNSQLRTEKVKYDILDNIDESRHNQKNSQMHDHVLIPVLVVLDTRQLLIHFPFHSSICRRIYRFVSEKCICHGKHDVPLKCLYIVAFNNIVASFVRRETRRKTQFGMAQIKIRLRTFLLIHTYPIIANIYIQKKKKTKLLNILNLIHLFVFYRRCYTTVCFTNSL